MGQSDLIALVAAAVGAFLGSGSAFGLAAWGAWSARRQERYAALMTAQFSVSMQLNMAVGIRNHWLAALEGDPERHMKLPLLHLKTVDSLVDMASIAFVAVDDEIETLQAVHVAQEAFQTVIHVVEARNVMVQAIYDSAQPTGDFDFESGVGASTLDARKVRVLKGMTDGLYSSVEAAIELGQSAMGELASVSRRMYPKKPVVRIEFASTEVGGPS